MPSKQHRRVKPSLWMIYHVCILPVFKHVQPKVHKNGKKLSGGLTMGPTKLISSSLRICRAPSSSPPAAYFSWPLTWCLPMCMQPLMIHSRPSGSSWQSATPSPYLAMIANQTIANINKIKPEIKKTNPSLFTYEDHSGPPVVRRWLQTGWAHPMLETCPALPSGGMSNSCLCCMQTVKFFEIGFSDQLYTRFQNKNVNI